MPYLTASQIKNYEFETETTKLAKAITRLVEGADYSPARSVFLSHSHFDQDLVRGAKNMLMGLGVNAYVDWIDGGLPDYTTTETAELIREKISESDKLIMIATRKALRSKWVPWELGCADGLIGVENIAVMPVERNPQLASMLIEKAASVSDVWIGNEYVGMYQKIDIANSGRLAVFKPGHSRGIQLNTWLRK